MINITKYNRADEARLISLLKNESDWALFTNDQALERFKNALLDSITLICNVNSEPCGYVRAIDDPFGIYVSELYVAPEQRGKGGGRKLLSTLKEIYSNREIYVLSDEDLYYKGLGLRKVGSVFQL